MFFVFQSLMRGGISTTTLVGLIMFVFAEPLTAFFVPVEDYVLYHGAMFSKIMAPSFGLLGVQQVMHGVFNGAGLHSFHADLYASVALF